MRYGSIEPRPEPTAALPIVWCGLLALAVGGPWLAGGYIFGTDWPGPRRFDYPTALSSSAPLQAALAAVDRILSGEATGKVLVFGILFAAAATAYGAIPTGGFVPRATASIIYVVNPFVFGRLHYGQLFLLAGYAALPWVALTLRRLFLEPGAGAAVLAALSLGLLGVLSLHLFLAAAVLVGALVVTHVLASRSKPGYVKSLAAALILTMALVLAVSSYWMIPVLIGRGFEGTLISGIGAGDLAAYAAVPDKQLGLLTNLLGLYGFWAEDTGRFASMKSFVPLWPVILGALLVVAAIGAAWAFGHRRDHLGAWVAGLLVAAAIAVILEMGISNPLTRDLVRWVDANFSIYRGMRDAGKWGALLALVYSQLIALGVAATLDWIRARPWGDANKEWVGAVTTGLLLALPLYYGNGLLFGMHGEIKPSQYPAGWYAADRVLASDGHPGRTLFLPWHEYMSFSFIRNQNKVVAPPGPSFFSVPIVVSSDPEVLGIAPPTDPDQVAISALVNAGDNGHWAEVLATHNVKYVLLVRELDWSSYGYLASEPGMSKVADFGSIVLFRINQSP